MSDITKIKPVIPHLMRDPADSAGPRIESGVTIFFSLLFIVFCFFFYSNSAQAFSFSSLESYLGKKNYDNKKYEEATKNYQSNVVDNPKDAESFYNLGNSFYRSQQYSQAAESYLKAAQNGDEKLKQASLYNLGNALYRLGELEKSITAYGKAVELDPQDENAKLNLEFVKRKLQEKQNQKQPEQQKQDQQNQENQDQPQNSLNNSGQDSQQNQQQQQQEQQAKDQQQNSQNQQNPQEQKPQDAENNPNQNSQRSDQQQDERRNNSEQNTRENQNPQNSQSSAGSEDSKQQKANLQEAKGGNMSEQEAEMWMGAIDENQSQILKNQIEKKLGRGRRAEKDW